MSQFDDPSGGLPPFDDDSQGGLPREEPPAEAQVEGPPIPDPAESPSYQVPVPIETLDRKVIVYWLLSGLLGWGFTAVLFGGGAGLVYVNWPKAWVYVLPAVVTLVGLQLVWVLVSPSLAFARWRFHVDSELLRMRYGILFIEDKAIPISRLQHVDLYRGLLERFLGLTTLIVFTAGTEGAHFRLPGLSQGRAQQLRDLILAARGDDVL